MNDSQADGDKPQPPKDKAKDQGARDKAEKPSGFDVLDKNRDRQGTESHGLKQRTDGKSAIDRMKEIVADIDKERAAASTQGDPPAARRNSQASDKVEPTERNDLTGELTPPGINSFARRQRSRLPLIR